MGSIAPRICYTAAVRCTRSRAISGFEHSKAVNTSSKCLSDVKLSYQWSALLSATRRRDKYRRMLGWCVEPSRWRFGLFGLALFRPKLPSLNEHLRETQAIAQWYAISWGGLPNISRALACSRCPAYRSCAQVFSSKNNTVLKHHLQGPLTIIRDRRR